MFLREFNPLMPPMVLVGEADAERNAETETATSLTEVFLILVLEISRTTRLDPMRMRDRSSRAFWLWRSKYDKIENDRARTLLFSAGK